MWGSQHIRRLWTALRARIHDELGTSMVEYTVLVAAFAIAVLGGLTFLGGAVGGSFADVVINAPLAEADYGINPHECKKGGWEGLSRDDGSGFKNQGDCMQYANTGK
ncbi:MAG: hypothetical protein BMS9Abin07_2115 [Acidimicrobiia bacterium]|nr:MAG: hypothetical protein BMS9Abin07_2115 [Acidimicrobiia bacterium]